MKRSRARRFLADPRRVAGTVLERWRWETGFLPDSGIWSMRLDRRGTTTQFCLTADALAPHEAWEPRVPEAELLALWALTQDRRLDRERTVVRWKRRELSLDRYQGPLEGLVLVETIEPDSQEGSFDAPASWGPEVTYDPRFSDRAMAEAPLAVPMALPSRDADSWAYGVVPYRATSAGWQILAVSTRNQDRWIVPKGRPEPRLRFDQVAMIEAWEEAGIKGRVTGHPLLLPYQRETSLTNLVLYPLRVTEVRESWPEARQRDRRWIDIDEAADWGEVLGWASRWVADQAV